MSALKKARELISNPKKWTKFALGANRFGQAVTPKRGWDQAIKFCALGALTKVKGISEFNPERLEPEVSFLKMAACKIKDYSLRGGDPYALTVSSLNDSTDHTTVMEMFDLAICMEERSVWRNALRKRLGGEKTKG